MYLSFYLLMPKVATMFKVTHSSTKSKLHHRYYFDIHFPREYKKMEMEKVTECKDGKNVTADTVYVNTAVGQTM